MKFFITTDGTKDYNRPNLEFCCFSMLYFILDGNVNADTDGQLQDLNKHPIKYCQFCGSQVFTYLNGLIIAPALPATKVGGLIVKKYISQEDIVINNLEILKMPYQDMVRIRFSIHSKSDKALEWLVFTDPIPSAKYLGIA